MNRLRNLIAGSGDGGGGPADGRSGGDRGGDGDGQGQSSWNSRYGYGAGSNPSRFGADDPYLSDDDDWGMSASAFSSPPTSSSAYDGDGGRRGSSAFWDQSALDGGGGGGISMEMSRSRGAMQDWEREAMTRDRMDDAFEIGDDDYYRSDRRSPGSGGSSAYADVQDDIRGLEADEADMDDTVSSSSSTQEEVVNAYRDYLKSIRDGGFESYLDKEAEPPDEAGDFDSGDVGNDRDEDEVLERTLDIEEERASGSLYGDLYGVHDMRSATSPYSAWRAKAKALLQQEQEREERGAASPSRQILDRFRRKRRDGAAERGNGNGGGDVSSLSSRHYSDSEKLYAYRPAIFQHPRFRAACIGICLVLALVAGLSYYGKKSDSGEDDEAMPPDFAIPPKTNEVQTTSKSEQSKGGSKGPHSGPSDAIQNALETFDPAWYDRRSGWEGITFKDAVNFCATKQNRVPCPYEIYCNQGADGDPYRGNRPNGEQWSPISNGGNQWVQVGGMFTCRRYTDLHDNKKPDWGITGVSIEHEHGAGGITQNLMCCVDVYRIGKLDPFTEWGGQDELDQVEGDHSKETAASAVVNVKDSENEKDPSQGNAAITDNTFTDVNAQKREKAVISAFQPIWFSSAHGWTGTSYEDAIHFCESYNHMVLCPYAAYCPNGQEKPALPGSMVTELDGEEWVPANGPMNTWVQIGTIDGDDSTRCTLHHEILGKRPQWGIDGTRQDVKHHIMCCLM